MNKEGNTDRKYKEGLEDNFLTHIGYEYTQQVCDELDREEDQWKNMEVPESLDQWLDDYIKLEKKRRKRKDRNVKLIRYSRRAAIVILCLIGVNFILVSNVDAYRVRWMNTITRIQQKFTQIDFVDEKADVDGYIPGDWAGRYYLTYLPDGYQISNTVNQGPIATITYTKHSGEPILFNQFGQNSSSRVDTEKGEITYLTINGDDEAFCLKKDDSILISWKQEDIVFQINAIKISQKDMIRMAESIALLK
jgi:hypothetical protein